MEKADTLWQKHAKISERVTNIYERLDFLQALTRQTPLGPYKLLYNTSGTHLCACVIDTKAIASQRLHDLPLQGFVAQHTTYWYETEDNEEVHFLCAILNASIVDAIIKPFQPKGMFGAQSGKGERHICRLPFEVLPIPAYHGGDERHRRLAELSRVCHEKVEAFVRSLSEKEVGQRIATLRQKVREMLRKELAEIDTLTQSILPVREAEPMAPETPPELFAGADHDVSS